MLLFVTLYSSVIFIRQFTKISIFDIIRFSPDFISIMSSFVPKMKENRQQHQPSTTTSASSTYRRSVCLANTKIPSTKTTTTTTSNGVSNLRRSVVPVVNKNKTPDLLHPPKFGGQQLANRKPDITKNLPSKIVQKPQQSQHVQEKPEYDSLILLNKMFYLNIFKVMDYL